MTYRNRVTRCRHGFAIGIVKCDECNHRQGLSNQAYLKGSSGRAGKRREGLRDSHGQVPASYRRARGNV